MIFVRFKNYSSVLKIQDSYRIVHLHLSKGIKKLKSRILALPTK